MKFFTDDSVDEGAFSLKGAAGLLWYVKTPASKLRAQFPIWNPQEDWSIGPPANKDIYVLKKGAKEWSTIKGTGEYLSLIHI